MKTILSYAAGQVKANRRGSLFIFLAITISTMLLTAITSFAYSNWGEQVLIAQDYAGNWHATFRDEIPFEQVKYLEENPQVEAVQLQSGLAYLALPQGPGKPYLAYGTMNAAAIQDLGLVGYLVAGRLPAAPGEAVVSSQLLEENPGIAIGDTLTLPQGNRLYGGEVLGSGAAAMPGEGFVATGSVTLTIVGSTSMQATSSYPAYHAYGYMDEAAMAPTEGVTVNLRYTSIRSATRLTPGIAAGLGLAADTHGDYPVRYNSFLLGLYGIKEGSNPSFSETLLLGGMGSAAVLLLFTMIIYSAFSVFSQSQVKQLGILKSVGGTPRQIRQSVLAQALLLALPAVPLGILLGFGAFGLLTLVAQSVVQMGDTSLSAPFTAPWILALVVLCSLATALLSAWGPARRLERLTPIEAVKGTGSAGAPKKAGSGRLAGRLLGLEGELAAGELAASRKSYRTTVLAMTLTLVLLCGAFGYLSAFVQYSRHLVAERPYNLEILYKRSDDISPALLGQLETLAGTQEAQVIREAGGSVFVPASGLAPALRETGINSRITSEAEQLDDGSYRLYVSLFGLEATSFAAYCEAAGVTSAPFKATGGNPVVLVNNLRGTSGELAGRFGLEDAPLLAAQAGDTLRVNEEVYPNRDGGSAYDVTIAATTSVYPGQSGFFSPYDVVLVAPMEVYLAIIEGFSPENLLGNMYMTINLRVAEQSLAAAQAGAEEIMGALPSTDYSIYSAADRLRQVEEGSALMQTTFLAAGMFLALVGMASAFSAVSASLLSRRRQFAVLRSIGLTPKGLGRMLFYESALFSLVPLLLALPLGFGAILLARGLAAPRLALSAVLAGMAWPFLLAAALLQVACVLLTYHIVGRRVKNETILDAIRDHTN